MNIQHGAAEQNARSGVTPHAADTLDWAPTLRAGLIGAVSIWIYEALVWVEAQHLMPLAGIPRNATGLVFGKDVQDSLGAAAYVVGTMIHFVFAIAWGVLFAFIWPFFRRRGFEATLAALFYAMVAWVVMHVAIMIVSSNHPNYYDPNVIVGGFMSHFFFTAPLALGYHAGRKSIWPARAYSNFKNASRAGLACFKMSRMSRIERSPL
jgi:hypothetical protein